MKTRHMINKEKQDEEDKIKRQQEMKRRKELFNRKDNIIRKNDMIVNPILKKIKLEPQDNPGVEVEVKQEVVEEEEQVEADDFEFRTVEVKVDLSEADEPAVSTSSLQNEPLEIILEVENANPVVVKQEVLEGEEVQELQLEDVFEMEVDQLGESSRVEENVDLSQNANQFCSGATVSASSSVQHGFQTTEALKNEVENLKALLKQRDLENNVLKDELAEAKVELGSDTRASVKLEVDNLKELLFERNRELERKNEIIASLQLQVAEMKGLLTDNDTKITSEPAFSNSSGSQTPKTKELLGNNENSNGGNLSSEEKVLYHFQNVLKLFIQQQENEDNLVNWRKLSPFLAVCRLVCKIWQESVDFLLQNDPSHFSLCGTKYSLADYKEIYTPCPQIISSSDLQLSLLNVIKLNNSCDTIPNLLPIRLLELDQAKDPSYNPIPSRHLMISHDHHYSSYYWDNYSHLVVKYLRQFGKNIWHLTVDIRRLQEQDLNKVCKFIWDVLQLLPNIQSLAMNIRHLGCPENGSRQREQFLFPHLKQLRTVQCTVDPHLYRYILSSNRHIQKLNFNAVTAPPIGTSRIMEIAFPNLSQVTCHVDGIDAWKMFAGATWNVKVLTLYFGIRCTRFEEKIYFPWLKRLIITTRDWQPKNWQSFLGQLDNLDIFDLKLVQSIVLSIPDDIKTSFVDYVNSFYYKTDWMKLVNLKYVCLTVELNNKRIGKGFQVEIKRPEMQVLKLALVIIDEKELD